MFIFKNKEINVDCFTSDAAVNKYTPIDYSHKFIPEWWHNLPKFKTSPFNFQKTEKGHRLSTRDNTMKDCNGFIDFFRGGFTLPLWSSFAAKNENGVFKFDFANSKVHTGPSAINHPRSSYSGFLENHHHLMFISPWLISTKEDINWAWIPHVWNLKNPEDMVILPGTLNFKNQCTSNINTMFNMKSFKEILLEPGQAMVNVIPLSDRKIKIHTHAVSLAEWNKIFNEKNGKLDMFFNRRLNRGLSLEKESEERSKRKCPF